MNFSITNTSTSCYLADTASPDYPRRTESLVRRLGGAHTGYNGRVCSRVSLLGFPEPQFGLLYRDLLFGAPSKARLNRDRKVFDNSSKSWDLACYNSCLRRVDGSATSTPTGS